MNNVLLLKLHRWTSLVFALPLLVIIVTGLILSVEPVIQSRGLPAGMADANGRTHERYEVLFLTGWTYPTTVSQNVGLSHDSSLALPRPPALSVPDGAGG